MDMDGEEIITFDAELRQVKSMVDGTYNIILNIPEYNLQEVKALMGELKQMVRIALTRS